MSSPTRDERIVEVTFPVRIKVRLGEIENGHSLDRIRQDLEDVITEAALDPAVARIDIRSGLRLNHHGALARLTPDDDGWGSFSVVVDKPTAALEDYIYEARDELRPHEVSP